MSSRKRYLFFNRALNDIDNIAPAIYFLLKSEPRSVVDILIYSDSYDFRDDPNLNFLKNTYPNRVSVTWLGAILGININWYFSSNLVQFIVKATGRLFPSKSITRVACQLRVSQDKINRLMMNWLIKKNKASLAVFDQNRSHAVRGLVAAIRYTGVKHVVSLPVSPFSNVSTLRSVDMLEMDEALIAKKHDYAVFDRVGVVDRYYLMFLESAYKAKGMESPLAKLAEPLGSIRYSKEWLEIRQKEKIYSSSEKDKSEKTTITFFLSDPATNVYWDEVLRTIIFISKMPHYKLIIKPHTRHKPPKMSLPPHVILDSITPSSTLIDQTDIVLFWGSSIALEGYAKGKFMACLDYVNGNLSIYKMFNAGFIMQHRDDLHLLLSHYRSEPRTIAYNKDGIEAMLSEIVSGGHDKAVSERYLEFIKDFTSS